MGIPRYGRSGIDQALYRRRRAGTVDQLVVWRDGRRVDGCMMATTTPGLDGGSANGVEYLAARSGSWSRRHSGRNTVRDSWSCVVWCGNACGDGRLRYGLHEIGKFWLPRRGCSIGSLARVRCLYPLSWFLRERMRSVWVFWLRFATRFLARLALDGQLGRCGVGGGSCGWGRIENTKTFIVRCVLGWRDIGRRDGVGRAWRAAESGGRTALFGAPVQPSRPTKVHRRRSPAWYRYGINIWRPGVENGRFDGILQNRRWKCTLCN